MNTSEPTITALVSNLAARAEQAQQLALAIKMHLLPEAEGFLGKGSSEFARPQLNSAGVLLGLLADLQDSSIADLDAIEGMLPSLLPSPSPRSFVPAEREEENDEKAKT